MMNALLNAAANQSRRSLVAANYAPAFRISSSSRCFSTKAAPTEGAASEIGYWEQKKQNKDRRRQLHQSRQERAERVKVRRVGKPKDLLKNVFRKYFIPKKVDDEYMTRKARQAGLDWKVQVAVICERPNVVVEDKADWLVKYEQLRQHLDTFGKIYPKEFTGEMEHSSPTKSKAEEEEAVALALQLASAAAGQLPSRVTEADRIGNVRTTDRKLQTRVYLLTQDPGTEQWTFPTVALRSGDGGGELLLEAAQRAMRETVGGSVEYWCPSNAPWSVDLNRFEEPVDSFYGTKTFFVKIQHDKGNVVESEGTAKDFAWLDRGEIVDRMYRQCGEKKARLYHYML
jgi:hypothetical protein